MGNVSGLTNSTLMMSSTSWGDYRDFWENRAAYFMEENRLVSNWTNLTEGEPYYLEADTYEGSGTDHFSLAVEIEQDDMPGHHHSMKEIQYLSLESAQVYESTRITITDPDSGQYLLIFQNPSDLSYT